MKASKNGDELIIELAGRIDSGNAPALEKELLELLEAHSTEEIVFDAERLTYISSAGLRVLMKVRKLKDAPTAIINVARDVYDIFETTGFTELFNVKKAYRSLSVEGLEVIGRGFFGTVYRIDAESIVKVYKGKDSIPMIENEKKMAQTAFLNGIPTAISYDIVRVGEDYGSVFELLNAKTFHELLLTKELPFPELISKYAKLLKIVHTTRLEHGVFPSYRERFLDYLDVTAKYLTKEQFDGLNKLLRDMKDEQTVVHGDIQMKNVMMVDNEPMLIDMDTLGQGNPVFDFAGLYVTYQSFPEDDPNNGMSFLQMPNEEADRLWHCIIEEYFDFGDDAERQRTVNKIALAAAIRFLFLMETTDLKESDLGRKRIAHAVEHIEELLKTVTSLALDVS
ncbi:MAG: anti-sigma factor antagonist [Lachnospiraceae bacterium]|nr:anti-sigma factor antagonist [Lachnospiraceae bacterium]